MEMAKPRNVYGVLADVRTLKPENIIAMMHMEVEGENLMARVNLPSGKVIRVGWDESIEVTP